MQTVYKCYYQGIIKNNDLPSSLLYIETTNGGILIGEVDLILELLNKAQISNYYMELVYQNALMEYPNHFDNDVRIEKGAVIRKGAILKKGAIILMNATVNKDAVIGEDTMVDMNAVVGSGAIIGKNTHIGAGAVISGIMEPSTLKPVIIGDNVFIGALSVILEGVKIADDAVVGAGSVVTSDVSKGEVVVGIPAKKIKKRSDLDPAKIAINKTLRRKF